MVEMCAHEPLAVAVHEEIYRARGHHAGEIRAQAFKVRAPALGARNGDEDLKRFPPVQESAAEEGEGVWWGDPACGARVGELGLVEVALQTGAEDVEGSGEEGGCHAAEPVRGYISG